MTLSQQLPRGTPEEQGISSSAIRAFVDAVEQRGYDAHSLMFLRHGHVVAEGWWRPYEPGLRHPLYSLSKSFTATAAGLAMAESYFGLDDFVLDYFPDERPEQASDNLAALRILHLL